MKLVQTLLVRDEIDVIEAQLEYHLSAGVDLVIATDHDRSRPAGFVVSSLVDQAAHDASKHFEVRLEQLPGFKDKRISGLLGAIEGSKDRPTWRLLVALNIPHVGSTTAQLLARAFGSIDAIAAASAEDIDDVEGIGPEIATSIHGWFRDKVNRKLVERYYPQFLDTYNALPREIYRADMVSTSRRSQAKLYSFWVVGQEYVYASIWWHLCRLRSRAIVTSTSTSSHSISDKPSINPFRLRWTYERQ